MIPEWVTETGLDPKAWQYDEECDSLEYVESPYCLELHRDGSVVLDARPYNSPYTKANRHHVALAVRIADALKG